MLTTLCYAIGGIAFTGICLSFADIRLFENPLNLVTAVFFALLPDIDQPDRPLGRLLLPISRFLYRYFGPRTLTHSLLCCLGVLLFFYLLLLVLCPGSPQICYHLTLIAGLAYAFHLLLDVCSQSGIPLFYPFSATRCVIPGDPAMRIPDHHPLARLLLLLGFSGVLLAGFPLMQQGFWMRYNNAFGTFSHLQSQFYRSQGNLELTFRTTPGWGTATQAITETGQVLAVKDKEAVVFLPEKGKNGTFRRLSEENTELLSFVPANCKPATLQLAFADIDEDSLRKLADQPLLLLVINCNYPVCYTEKGELKQSSAIRLEYVAGFAFSVQKADTGNLEQRIFEKQLQLRTEREKWQTAADSLWHVNRLLTRLETGYESLSDYEKGKATAQLTALRQWKATHLLPSPDARMLEAELAFLYTRRPHPPVFSGYLICLNR